jgi:AcrR family transcriptional regulator
LNTSNETKSKRLPGLRATQKEATGQAVLEAAREEFERVGFEAANLRAIAARAGVSAGTVLHHYGAIAKLAEAAMARGELQPDVDGALFGAAYFSFFYFALISWVQGAHGSPVELVEHLMRQHLEGLRPNSKPPPRRDR